MLVVVLVGMLMCFDVLVVVLGDHVDMLVVSVGMLMCWWWCWRGC